MTPHHPTPSPAAPKQPVVKATVWHKIDHNTMFQPYEAGHRVEPVFEFELGRDEWLHLTGSQAPDAAVLEFAENAFAAFNHQPPQGWETRSRAYNTAGNRSLSVGDLVVIGEVAWAVERFGFPRRLAAQQLLSGARLERLKAAATRPTGGQRVTPRPHTQAPATNPTRPSRRPRPHGLPPARDSQPRHDRTPTPTPSPHAPTPRHTHAGSAWRRNLRGGCQRRWSG
jgi:hypothetical protein